MKMYQNWVLSPKISCTAFERLMTRVILKEFCKRLSWQGFQGYPRGASVVTAMSKWVTCPAVWNPTTKQGLIARQHQTTLRGTTDAEAVYTFQCSQLGLIQVSHVFNTRRHLSINQ